MNMKALTALCVVALGLPVLARSQTVASPPVADSQTVIVQGEKPAPSHTWFKAESRHFVVYSDARHNAAKDLLDNLERYAYVLRTFSNMSPEPEKGTPKFVVYYLTDRRDLSVINPAATFENVGLYQSCEDGVQGFALYQDYKDNPSLPVEKRPEDQGLIYIFQAYARHFFYASFPQRTPLWYIEGYAQYFSTMRFDGDKAYVGLAPHAVGALLAEIDVDRHKPMLDYVDVLNDDTHAYTDTTKGAYVRSRPLRPDDPQYIAHNEDRYGGDKDMEARQAESEFEAHAWILTHWILSSHENTQKMQTYVTAISVGESETIAFRRIYGDNPAALKEHMRRYLRGKLPAGVWNAHMPDSDVTFETLPVPADRLLLWQAALKTCPSEVYGKTLLSNIRGEATAYPDNALVQMTLARAEILYGDPRKALAWLSGAGLNDRFEAQHLLGRAQLAIALSATGDAQATAFEAAGEAFDRAATLDPASATNAFWYYRARVLTTGTLPPDAAGAAIMAWTRAPEVDAYAFNAALVYAEAGKRGKALDNLRAIATNPRPGTWTKPAAAWIKRLNGVAPRRDIIAGIIAASSPQPGQAEWTSAGGELLGETEVRDGWSDFMAAKTDSDAVLHPPSHGPNSAEGIGQRPAEEQ